MIYGLRNLLFFLLFQFHYSINLEKRLKKTVAYFTLVMVFFSSNLFILTFFFIGYTFFYTYKSRVRVFVCLCVSVIFSFVVVVVVVVLFSLTILQNIDVCIWYNSTMVFVVEILYVVI